MEQSLAAGGVAPIVGIILTLLAALGVLASVILSVVLARAPRKKPTDADLRDLLAQALDQRIGELARIQAETAGRVHTMGEVLSGRQAELARAVGERLDAVTHRVGQSMQATAQQTAESLQKLDQHTAGHLQKLHERLAVIDSAQKNLTDLTSQVGSLRDVLANKQARGAFGQGRMEVIVRDGLPKGCYEFQFTLSNRTRPDCAIFLPGDKRPIVIDAKFPLEAVTALRQSQSDEARRLAAQRLRQDVLKHVGDIAQKYLIPGETQELALMFVPSESVYAELHDGFDDVVQKAYRARVVLVSPSLLMLAIQVMQQIQRDARMREAAECIRTEVDHMVGDLGRLRERVLKLHQHFGQAAEDVRQILISADKIDKRADRIRELEFEEEGKRSATVIPAPIRPKLEAGE
jgi:DNA recombination protein RmuC